MKTILYCISLSLSFLATTAFGEAFMKRADYLDLAEIAVNAYSDEHIRKFVADTERDGVQSHGFPRLTACIGLLIANGRQAGKREVFVRMMDVSCRDAARGKMPYKAGGNEFSVKELVFALVALEKAGVYPKEKTEAWRTTLSKVDAWRCYQKIHKPDMSWSGNWPVFGCASEQARRRYGLGGDRSFIDMYAADYLRWFDENGMFKDPYQPAVYDCVTRLQFMHVLDEGYDGPIAGRIAAALDRGAEATLWLQSAAGEIPYGGRSNQFLHNNTFFAAVCEWYAVRSAKKGDREKALRFRRAAKRAADELAPWLAHRPLNHVKNFYPRDDSASTYDALPAMGCEKYAFFNQYMVTMASWAMSAWRFCDESIVSEGEKLEEPPFAFATSPEFHWVFLSAGDYSAQFDWLPNEEYDSVGLGRVHRRGAPTAICLSTPCTKAPHYRRETKDGAALAILPVVPEGTPLRLFQRFASANRAQTRWFVGDFEWNCILTSEGLDTEVKRPGKVTPPGPVALALPAFEFDGAAETQVACDGKTLSVAYGGWVCRYATEDGSIVRTDVVTSNRNGRYRRYEVRGETRLKVRVTIDPVTSR